MNTAVTITMDTELAEKIRQFSKDKDIGQSKILREGAKLFMDGKNGS